MAISLPPPKATVAPQTKAGFRGRIKQNSSWML